MIQDQSIESWQGTENSKTVSYWINRFRKVQLCSSFSLTSMRMTSVIAKNRHWICPSLMPWICSKNTRHITQPAIHNFSSAVHPFDLICSKIFISRVSIWLHVFKNFCQPCVRLTASMQKFSSSVHPASRSVSNGLAVCFSSVCLPCVHS